MFPGSASIFLTLTPTLALRCLMVMLVRHAPRLSAVLDLARLPIVTGDRAMRGQAARAEGWPRIAHFQLFIASGLTR